MRSLEYFLLLFENHLHGLAYAKSSIANIAHQLRHFAAYANAHGIDDVREIKATDIDAFIAHMRRKITNRGGEFSAGSIARMISSLRIFFKFLYRSEHILINPMEGFAANIRADRNRKEIFTPAEMTRFLDSIDIDDDIGLRDRAIFELMYSSGLRISEVVKLDVGDVDLNERVLLVREGKGGKDRFVPFSRVAAAFIMKYIEHNDRSGRKGRMRARGIDESALFIGRHGRMQTQVIRLYFRKYLEASGITRRNLSPHSIRHSCATHLLEAGADVRYVQELLGHEHIQTTVKYTHLMIEGLKRVYKMYHPRENQFYEEIDEEYLRGLERLKSDVAKRRATNRRYPHKRKRKAEE